MQCEPGPEAVPRGAASVVIWSCTEGLLTIWRQGPRVGAIWHDPRRSLAWVLGRRPAARYFAAAEQSARIQRGDTIRGPK